MQLFPLDESSARAIAALLTAVSAFIAASAFALSVWKNISDVRASNRASARTVWNEYVTLAFDHPDLALSLATVEHPSAEQREKYEWFVSRLLYAAEQALMYSPNDRHWKSVIQQQFGYHKIYLREKNMQNIENSFSPELYKIYQDWAKDYPSLKVAEHAGLTNDGIDVEVPAGAIVIQVDG